jgi:hypothetical protein
VPCRQWARIHQVRYGVWGGESENDRAAVLAGEPAGPNAAAGDARPPAPGPARPGRITNPQDRRHGTTERYASGPDENGVPGRPCRCRQCLDAYNAGRNDRTRMKAYGRWEPFTDAEEVRRHVRALQEFGIGCGRIAALAGVSPGTVKGLVYRKGARPPSRVIRPDTRDRILSVQPVLENLDDAVLVDPDPYRGQLRALIAAGWSPRYLAGRIAMNRAAFYRILAGGQKQIAAATAKAVTRAWRDLQDLRPPQRTAAQRKTAETARSLARRHGWALRPAPDDQPARHDPQPRQPHGGGEPPAERDVPGGPPRPAPACEAPPWTRRSREPQGNGRRTRPQPRPARPVLPRPGPGPLHAGSAGSPAPPRPGAPASNAAVLPRAAAQALNESSAARPNSPRRGTRK